MKRLLLLLLVTAFFSCKQQSIPLHTPYLQRAAQEEKPRTEKQLSMINHTGHAERKGWL